jgi:prepilin-type N-terminal cleavage/methylation domain-containing protein
LTNLDEQAFMNNHKFHPDSGFTLLEVVVSIVVVTFFTAATMQMLATSAMFKARAKEYAAAANLIQEDFEAVRNEASRFEFPTVSSAVAPPASPATSQIQLNSALVGINTASSLQFTGTPNVYTSYTLDTVNNRITISSPGLRAAVASGAVLVNNTLCNAGNATTGLANQFDTRIALSNSNPNFPTFSDRGELPADYADYRSVSATAFILKDNQGNNTQKRLWVMRKETPVNIQPFDVLNVRYLVVKDNNGTPSNILVNQLTSEVIPNAAYQCIKQ